jgi:hypothetical protein
VNSFSSDQSATLLANSEQRTIRENNEQPTRQALLNLNALPTGDAAAAAAAAVDAYAE